MTLILLLKFLSCQSLPEQAEKPVVKPQPTVSQITITLDGVDKVIRKRSLTEVNKHRKYKVGLKAAQGDFVFEVHKATQGYLVVLKHRRRQIQKSRALGEYEVALVIAALARDHIPDQVSVPNQIPYDF